MTNKILKKFIFAITSFLMMIAFLSVFTHKVYAEGENRVYFNNATVDANDSGLVIAEFIVEGKVNDKVSVYFHTIGGTAIQGVDYTGVSNKIDLQIDNSNKTSYKISIKCLNTPENRSKYRIVSSDATYGRYFNIKIDKADNAVVDEARNICKCYLPFNHQISATTKEFNKNGVDVSYLNDLNHMEYRWTNGSTDIEKGHPWKTWEHGITFHGDLTNYWVNAFINEGLASAYTSFVIKELDDEDFLSYDDIYTYCGNREMMEKFYDSTDCPGLYLVLYTEPCSYGGFWGTNRRGFELGLEAMNAIAEGKNPYDEEIPDDDSVDVEKVFFYTDKRKIYWKNTSNTWYASDYSFINTTFYKVQPYNGILDVGLAVRNNDGDQDRIAKRIWQFLTLVDDKAPEVVSEYVDDSYLKETGKLRFYVRFNEPVHSAYWNTSKGSSIQVNFNNGSQNFYANYVEGNYTDTLVYELEDVPKTNITSVSYQLPNDDISDMAYNLDKYKEIKNNRISEDITNQARSMTLLNGEINNQVPTAAVDVNSSSFAKNIYNLMLSINDNGAKEINRGAIYYEWSQESTKENNNDPNSYKKAHEFNSEEGGSFNVTLVKNEAEGITSGTYYLHALAESIYGIKNYGVFGPYVLDGDPPVIVQNQPEINNLKTKEYQLVVEDKKSNATITAIYVVAKYSDSGQTKESKLKIVENGQIINSHKKFIRSDYDDATSSTTYYYKSNIDPSILDDDSNPLIDNFIRDVMGSKSRLNVDISFIVEDSAGNSATSDAVRAVYDIRNLFKVKFNVPLVSDSETDGYTLIDDISVLYKAYDYSTVVDNKNIVIEILDETAGGTLDGSNYQELLVAGTKFSISINGKEIEASDSNKFSISISDLEAGFYEIVPKISGVSEIDGTEVDIVADSISFYLSNNKKDMTKNYSEATGNLVLSNKVYQLKDSKFYYLDQSGSTIQTHLYGRTYDDVLAKYEGGSSNPTFSNINEAKKYIRYMEYQDMYLIKITPTIASLLNSGSNSTNYVKAQGEVMTAQDGQLWIRYKKNTWSNTSTAFAWGYYYYGNGNIEDGININNLSTNLTNAINEVVNRITNEGVTVYLVEDENLNQINHSPYLSDAQMHINEEEASITKMGTKFVAPVKYTGDGELYKNNVSSDGINYPLATNMAVKVDSVTRLFYKYAAAGNWVELKLEEGKTLSTLLDKQTSGFYLFREYGNEGINEFSVYIDKTLPLLNVLIGDVETLLDGQTLAFSTSSFTIKSIEYEVDTYSYVAVYSYPTKKLLNVLYDADIKAMNGYSLIDGNYYIQVGDRSGNFVTYTMLLSTSVLEVETKINDSQTSLIVNVLNRDEDEIYAYEIYLNESLVTTEFNSTNQFRNPGVYRIVVSDIYGNTVSKVAEFQYRLPEITWYYLNSSDSYSKYDEEHIVNMVIYEDSASTRISNVYTSTMLKMVFVTSYGDDNIKFEILDLESGDYSYQESTNTISINTLAGFRFRVWYEKNPESDHMYVVRVDTEAPTINSSFIGTTHSHYYEEDEQGKIVKSSSIDLIDLSSYAEGDYVNLDTLAYTEGQTEKIDFYNQNVISGGHIVLALSDPTGIKSYTITRNGQKVQMELNADGELIINSYGKYEVTVTDLLGNVARMSFINTNEAIATATIDGNYLKENEQSYGNDNVSLNILYPGENKILIRGENETYTYVLNYDGSYITYGRYVCSIEKREDEDGNIVDYKKATYVQNQNYSFNTLASNIRTGIWYPMISESNHNILVSVVDGKPVIKVEVKEEEIELELAYSVGNNVFPSYFIATLSKESPDIKILTGEDEIEIIEGSKYIYVADELTIDSNINNNIVKIEAGFDDNPNIDRLTTIYEDGEFKQEFIGLEDGFYRILVTNKFNNQKEYLIVKVASFKSIVNVIYRDETTKTFSTNEDTIYSNAMISLDVYSDTVSFEVNGERFSGINKDGVTTLELYKSGNYQVKVISNNGIFENFNLVIDTDNEFIFKEEWLTGYNENALLKDQGYTSNKLSINRNDDVVYVAYQFEDKDLVVLYDAIAEEKIIAEDKLIEAIGNDGAGTYKVLFKNKYGDSASKTIHYNNVAGLELFRKIVDSSSFERYDLQKAIALNFYSNYILRFSTNSLKYEFTIDGNNVSLEEAKTIEFTNSSGNGSFGYQITYLDEYGNYVEFVAELYRTDVVIDKSQMTEILVGKEVYTKNNIIITFADNLIGKVSVDGSQYKEYISGTKFYKDGKYDFIVEDIAGNRNKYSIIHKSINHYTLTDTSTGQPVIIGGVINNSSVSFSATDDSKITKIFNNGKQLNDFNSTSFTTTGHWEIIIEDSVGNQAYAGFYVINNELSKFDYNSPFDYEISEVWYISSNGQRDLLDLKGSSISLIENGDYIVVVTGKETTTSFNFSVTIDNTPPQVTLEGVEDNGVTARDVKVKGLKSGDIVEIYKDGQLVSTTSVGLSNVPPEITTGGEYRVVVTAASGAQVEYNFTRKKIANSATSIFIIVTCLLAVAGITIGLLYHTKLKTDDEK